MGDKKVKKKTVRAKKGSYFDAKGDKLERKKKFCPKCGPGIFMASHKNRDSCGKCGYTEMKTGENLS